MRSLSGRFLALSLKLVRITVGLVSLAAVVLGWKLLHVEACSPLPGGLEAKCVRMRKSRRDQKCGERQQPCLRVRTRSNSKEGGSFNLDIVRSGSRFRRHFFHLYCHLH